MTRLKLCSLTLPNLLIFLMFIESVRVIYLFAISARNLGVVFDSGLTMKQQVDGICQTAYSEIRRIGSLRQFLTTEATKILVTSLVLSCLDYCNSLLAGILQKLVKKTTTTTKRSACDELCC